MAVHKGKSTVFASGATLKVFTREQVEERQRSGSAPGGLTPIMEPEVKADGTHEATGLTAGVEYAYYGEVAGKHRYVTFRV
jgi:hypothetical protein